jgi:two-component system C4-dicarboxylate transport response regulator DctD
MGRRATAGSAQPGEPIMVNAAPVLVYEPDRSVLASLEFSLALQGFAVADGASSGADPLQAACLIIEQRLGGRDGLDLLADLRAKGCRAPAVLLSTNPTRKIRERAASAKAVLVEKPLLSDGLTRALHTLLQHDGTH